MKTILAAAAALALAGAAAAQDAVLHAGKLLAEPGEGYQSERTILIRDGRIADVSRGYQLPADDIPVIDLKDAYVLPGLIDSHVHLLGERSPTSRLDTFTKSDVDAAFDGAQHALRTLMAGFTTVQDVGGGNASIFALRDAIAAGKVPGPRIRAAGRAVTVTGGHGDANGYSAAVMAFLTGENACNGADDCRRAVRQLVKEGADLIKITATGGVLSNTAAGLEQQFTNDELSAIVEAASSMGRKVTAHAHGKSGIDAALRAGVASIEHGTYLDDETIRLFRDNDATLVPTVLAGVTVTGWTNEPWLPEASRIKAAEVGPRMLDMLARARRGGVNIAYGTDTGVSKHGENAKEFALMVEAGFSEEDAIRAATIVAAEHVEMAADIGSIEEGKFADIIAVRGDPLEDIAELEDVDFVMKGGVVHKSE
ncbi:MAG: amidohydrolase family protein [Pseudomonadota bacterium]